MHSERLSARIDLSAKIDRQAGRHSPQLAAGSFNISSIRLSVWAGVSSSLPPQVAST